MTVWFELLYVGARELRRKTDKFSMPMLFSWGICFYWKSTSVVYALLPTLVLYVLSNWFIMTDIQWANWGFTWPNPEKPWGED